AGDSERRERWLAQVRYGFERIRTIVSSLSNFARARPTGGPANVARTVEQALALLRHSSGFRGVEVQCEGVAEASDVAVDPGQLEQVLINLLLNASRAMEGEGRIWIRARTIDDPRSGASSVEITHEDEGPGIAEEALETIFDPFFSTTGSTGLGLSVSYGIITAHGGALSAENRPEGGARFTIRVPAATPAAVPEERGAKRAAE
ncbi:MAG TPA: ATP-binding protein, partial [Planctomycetota bacterium]|nr:ATP-binding protein [Planctomycetota bacterium]